MPVVLKKKKPLPVPSNPPEQPGAVIKFPAAAALPNVELSEDAIAEAFAQAYGARLRFDHTRGKWFVWDGSRWKRNDTELAFDYARHLCRLYRKDQLRMSSRKAAEGVELMAQRDQRLAVTSEIWDREPFLLGTPGGTVDLKTGVLQKATKEHFITKLTTVTPAATADCPLFLKFLAEATGGDEELQGFIQRWAGYCLTGDTSEHALLFIYGPGGNGKGVLKTVMTDILGDYAAIAGMDTFAAAKHHRHLTELAMLDGARLVAVSETEQGQAWSETPFDRVGEGECTRLVPSAVTTMSFALDVQVGRDPGPPGAIVVPIAFPHLVSSLLQLASALCRGPAWLPFRLFRTASVGSQSFDFSTYDRRRDNAPGSL